MTNHLRGKRLHQLNRIGAHTIAVVEILGHAEYHDVIFFLGKRYISTLIRHNPGLGLHHLRVTGIDLNLTGIGVQYRVAAEKGMSHLFFHQHSDLIEFRSHHAMSGNRCEIRSVHNLRNMVGSYGTPVGDTGRTVLVASGITAVGIALGVTNQDGNIAIEHILIHQNPIAALGTAQIHQMLIIFRIMTCNLMGPVKLVK